MATEKRLIPLSKRIVYAGDVFNSLMAEKKWSATEASDFMKEFATVNAVEVVHGYSETLGKQVRGADPTAYNGEKKITEEEQIVADLVWIIKKIARWAGFEILNRIEFRHRMSGRKYR